MPSAFVSLSDRVFRWYLATTLAASANLWAFWIAQTWLIVELTDADAMWIGMTTASQFFPILVFGLLGGVLADRFHKIKVLAVCDAALGLLALLSAALVYFDLAHPSHVIAIALCAGTCSALSQPSRQTLPADIVNRDHLVSAMGLTSSVVGVGRIVGPLLAAIVLSVADLELLFGFAGVAMASSALALLWMFGQRVRPPARQSRHSGGAGGIHYLISRRDLSVILAVMVVVCALGWNSQVMIALVSERVFQAGASFFGVLTALFALGGVLGTLRMARRDLPTPGSLVRQLLGMAILTMLTGLAPGLVWFGGALVLLGFAAFQLAVAINVTFIAAVPSTLRGRVVAILLVCTNGSVAIGGVALGLLARYTGPRAAYVWSGLIILGALGSALVAYVGSTRLRNYPWLRQPEGLMEPTFDEGSAVTGTQHLGPAGANPRS